MCIGCYRGLMGTGSRAGLCGVGGECYSGREPLRRSELGPTWHAVDAGRSAGEDGRDSAACEHAVDQDIRYCLMPNGARIAYAVAGQGPPLIQVPGWIMNMAIEDRSGRAYQAAREWLRRHHTLVRYDRYG